MTAYARTRDSLTIYMSSVKGRILGQQDWDARAVAVAILWACAIILDAVTTLGMMATGRFEEANPVAALGMQQVGTFAYVALASLASAAYGALGLGRPRDAITWAVCATAMAAGTYKLTVAISNLLLAVTGREVPLPL